jgi:hypothetical protein
MLNIKTKKLNIAQYYGFVELDAETIANSALETQEVYSTPMSFKHTLDVDSTNNVIKYKFENITQGKTYYNVSIPFSLISKFDSQSYISFSDLNLKQYIDNNGTQITTTLSGNDAFNIFDDTLSSKSVFFTTQELDNLTFPLKIFVPCSTCSPQDYVYLIQIPDNSLYTNEFKGSDNTNLTTSDLSDVKTLLAPVSLSSDKSSYVAGDVAVITITTTDPFLGKVYLDPKVGVVNKTVVPIKNKTGTFKILTEFMDSGDTIDIKVNFKSWTGVARYTTTLG